MKLESVNKLRLGNFSKFKRGGGASQSAMGVVGEGVYTPPKNESGHLGTASYIPV